MASKKQIAVLLAAAMGLLLALGGCADQGSTASSTPAEKDHVTSMTMVGVSVGGSEAEGDDGSALRDSLQEMGYTVELAYAEGSSETQSSQIGAILEDGASVLIVEALDGEAAAEALSGGDVSDVTVIAMGTPIGGKNVDYYVGCDWTEMGRLQAQRAVERLKPDKRKESAAVELLTDGGAGSALALEGAMEVLQPYLDGGILFLPSGNADAEACRTDHPGETVKQLLKEQYEERELGALLCLGSSQAAEAVETLKADYRGGSFPVVTTSGWQTEYAELMEGHLLDMAALDRSERAGEQTLALVQTLLSGGTPEEGALGSRPAALTREQLKDFLAEGMSIFPESDGNAVK